MRVGLVQLTSSDDPGENALTVKPLIEEAVAGGAEFVLTPEVTNCLSTDRAHQRQVLRTEERDATLSALRDAARSHEIWLLTGSLALLSDAADGKFANRSFLIAPDGAIAARYDKIHMFDVEIGPGENYRESAGFHPGSRAVTVPMPGFILGMTICYDVRFPHLFRALSKAGAGVIAVPSAFAPSTGRDHWETLLRARAIENGAFVLAPAQCGLHTCSGGTPRRTHGHSLAISPWGDILLDMGDDPGVGLVDLNLELVREARQRIPALTHDRPFEGP